MDYVTSRLRYFNGQFLLEKDFTDQQAYHIGQSNLHDRMMHVWGIAEGLSVIQGADTTKVTVEPGAAIDKSGNLILLAQAEEVSAPAGIPSQVYYLVIVFHEVADTMAAGQYVAGNTRFTQRPQFQFVPDGSLGYGQVVLAQLDVGLGGALSILSGEVRTYAGARLPAEGDKGFDLRPRPDGPGDTKLSIERFTDGVLAPDPLVTIDSSGRVGIGQTSPIAMLDVSDDRSGSHPAAVKGLYVTADFGADSDGVEFRHSNGSQGIGFGFNTIYAAGSNPSQDLGLKPKGSGVVAVSGTLRANTLTFPGPPGDPAPVITARTIPAGQGASSERTELILFHSNDNEAFSGTDCITLRAPAIRLQTFNDATVTDIDNDAGANDRLYIRPGGNVGIGTTAPNSKLEVAGQVHSTSGGYRFPDNSVQTHAIPDSAQVPIGAVLDWFRVNTSVPVPDGYKLCDGTQIVDAQSPLNGQFTPNLVGRFVLGVAPGASEKVAGGTSTHSHTVTTSGSYSGTTSSAGNHNHHYYEFESGSNQSRFYTGGSGYGYTFNWGDGIDTGGSGYRAFYHGTESRNFYTNFNGSHSHSFSGSISTSGSTNAPNHMPLYVGLLKIMRIR